MIEYIEQIEKSSVEDIDVVEKFNPYHDAAGRFTTADGATSFTFNPSKGRAWEQAAEREWLRTERMYANKPRKGQAQGLGEEHAKAIEKIIRDKAPDEVKAMWERFGDDVKVGDAHSNRSYELNGKIYIDIEDSARGQRLANGTPAKPPYQTAIHESGHAIAESVSKLVGYEFDVIHNGGEFQKLLVKETNAYFKKVQKDLSQQWGRNVSIAETRKQVAVEMFAKNDRYATSFVSDILGGATKGKFVGPSRHPSDYWKKYPVSVEAFAHFTSMASNERGSAELLKIFPESYKEYLSMCEFAANL